jgi:hypothetical protein
MSYKRKTKIEFTAAQERKLRRLAQQRDSELWSRFCGYVTNALKDHTRSKFTISVWDGHIDSVSSQERAYRKDEIELCPVDSLT